ncbi:MAG: hypothetical protein LAT68_05365 [Cyclobacteriaceae bacterium]|nr:hypothetical protein [Cyclobacteriaceae bacterium]MCH8515739.1 hypothetical protein [Cyclobacteriaceae bacterium]
MKNLLHTHTHTQIPKNNTLDVVSKWTNFLGKLPIAIFLLFFAFQSCQVLDEEVLDKEEIKHYTGAERDTKDQIGIKIAKILAQQSSTGVNKFLKERAIRGEKRLMRFFFNLLLMSKFLPK